MSNKLRQRVCFRCSWAFYVKVAHYSDVIWASWRLKSTTLRLFVQQLGQADIKDIKVQHHWPFRSRIYSAVPSQRVSNTVLEWRHISVMSNHRRLNYSFNSLPRLITKDKSKILISGSLWGGSGDRWIPLGKSRQFKKRFHVIESSTTIASIILAIFYTLTHWTVFGRDFL